METAKRSPKERPLDTVIFFVTSRCNAFCETCFYHEELNKGGDLTFEEIEKLSLTMPAITDLWLSGGEPTLRKDLGRIIKLFVANNGISKIVFPTNGLLKERVYEQVDEALSHTQIKELYLNIALDGYGETHDRIRGVPKNWEKTISCIEYLYPLKEKYGQCFRLNVNTVLCAENYSEMEKLGEFLWGNFQLDSHFFNIIRGETKAGDGIKLIPPDALAAAYKYSARLTKRYSTKYAREDRGLKRFLKQAAYYGTIMTHHHIQRANFETPSPWGFSCTAGETSCVIDYDGRVRACELLDDFGSLRDFGFDFAKLWAANSRQEELARIDGGKSCWCTHVCFIHSSLKHSSKAIFYDIPKNYLLGGRT